MEPEFNYMSVPGVSTCTTRISLGDSVTIDNLRSLEAGSIDAAALISEAPMDVIVLGCTSGSFIGGKSYDCSLIKKMEEAAGGVPCTTTGSSVIEALKKSKIKRPAVFTPYTDDINKLCNKYLHENGIEPVETEGINLTNDHEISSITPDEIRDRVLNMKNLKDCDGIFISCTGLKTLPVIEEIEQSCGKPVISAIQASFWNCLRICRVDNYTYGPGSLFRKEYSTGKT